MTAAAPTRPRSRRRGLWRALAIAICGFVLISGAVFALYVSRPRDGLGHDIIDAIEIPFERSEALRFNAHMALGAILSLCSCTSELSADQYHRASFHRPNATAAP